MPYVVLGLVGLATLAAPGAAAVPAVYPWPQAVQPLDGEVVVWDGSAVRLTVPPGAIAATAARAIERCRARISELSGQPAAWPNQAAVELRLSCGAAAPDRPQGYRLRISAAPPRVEITGHDPAGLVYGLGTLRQLLLAAGRRVVLPACEISDWPDLPWRSLPMTRLSRPYLDWATATARINACFTEPLAMNWGTRRVARQSREQIAADTALLHEYGLTVVPTSGWHRQWARQELGRDFCPSQDTAAVLDVFADCIAAGVDGLAWHFDDLTEAEMKHHLTCPQCRGRFPTLASWQVHCLRQMLQLGQRHGLRVYWACPSIYSLHAGGSRPDHYQKILGLPLEAYLRELCGFAGAEAVSFYYCEFVGEQLTWLKEQGLRNYIWWNNGPWSAGGPEVWGSYIAFPRMRYSWDLYDRRRIIKDQTEVFDDAAYRDLGNLRQHTNLVYSGTSDPIAVGLGGHFGWHNAAFVEHEEELRDWLADQLFSPSGHIAMRQWEALAPPLWVKCLRLQAFDAADRAKIDGLDATLADLRRSRSDPYLLRENLPAMQQVVHNLRGFADLIAPLPGSDPTQPGWFCGRSATELLVVGPAATVSGTAREATLQGPPVGQALVGGRPALLVSTSQWQVRDPAFSFGERPFSIDVWFTPTVLGSDQYTAFAGNRGTYREIYPGNPGWAFGYDGRSRRARFTVEDAQRQISSVEARTGLELNKPFRLTAVRDTAQRKLLLYVNGKLEASVAETGALALSGGSAVSIGYDGWGGSYVIGGLHRLALLDRALAPAEITALP
ncbi:MAG: hypothetical protein IT204_05575 [Fimbriimonadaceae bacterium]|nr:hypothetical protein [Fimbriimonadaceae bacterium]